MTELAIKKKRPLWLNMSPLNLPVPGLVSIFHRISGVALFVGLFWLLYLLQASLASPQSFETFKAALSHPFAKLCLLVLVWSYLHHFCAGIRYLAMDIHWTADLPSARKTAGSVFAVSLILTLIVAVKIW
jgi:succinate dehydrogenase / fumarate reductase cytochrome b subunit